MSKLAKRLASPDLVCPDHWSGPDWVLTEGPLVADLCATAGFAPDPAQALGLDMIFAVGADGHPASFAFCVVCCRQVMKTGLLKQAALGWLFVTEQRRIVWSAHELSTSRQAHQELASLIEDTPALAKYLPNTENHGIYSANGQERIETAAGQNVFFRARTLTGGRGLTGDKTILDEAFALKSAHTASLLPTMLTRPDAQVLYASSAPLADSHVLRDIQKRGHDGSSPRLAYIEYRAPFEECAEEDCRHPKDAQAHGIDCALDRRHLWRAAYAVALRAGRITEQAIADLRQELDPADFAVECLGWPVEIGGAAGTIFGPGRWEACAGEPEEAPEAPTAIGVAVSVDRTWASIAAASLIEVLEDPDDPEAEPVDRLFVAAVDRREGVGWLAEEVARIQSAHDCAVVIDNKGPTADLLRDLEDADVAVDALSLDQYAGACSRFFDKVRGQRLMHPSSAELDEAVSGAVWRQVGDRQVWGRRKSTADVSMLEAATLAGYGAEQASTFTL